MQLKIETMTKKLSELELKNTILQKENDELTQELKQSKRHTYPIDMEKNRVNAIIYKEKEVALDKLKCDEVKERVSNHLRDYQDSESLHMKAKGTREKTEKLIDDNLEMVKNMQSESNNSDEDEGIKAMNNAIKVLQEKLECSKSDEEKYKDMMYEAKVAWNRDKIKYAKVSKESGKTRIVVDDLKEMNDITFNIKYPNWSYSEGQVIANLVESNNATIKQLVDLPHLGGNDMDLLAESLLSNTNLRMIEFAGNIVNKGVIKVVSSLFDTASLDECSACNHTCQVKSLFQNQRFMCINEFSNSKTNRAMKIFTLLTDTDKGFYDMECFNDISIKCIPRLLDLAQHFSEDSTDLAKVYYELSKAKHAENTLWKHSIPKQNKPLTSMFEMFRGWGVSLLCE